MESYEILFGLLELAVIRGLNFMGLLLMFVMLPKKILDGVLLITLWLVMWSLVQTEIFNNHSPLWYDFRLVAWFGLATATGSAGFFIHEGKRSIACGLALLCIGGVSNQLVVALNGFKMPVVVISVFEKHYFPLAHQVALSRTHVQLWWLADWIPGYMAVISPGDILIDGGALVMLASYISMKVRGGRTERTSGSVV